MSKLSRPIAVFRRLQYAVREYGGVNLMLLAVHRGMSRLSRQCSAEKYYVVAQPLPQPLDPRRGRKILIRQLGAGDLELRIFKRAPGELDDRFAQGAMCIGAFSNDDLAGWMWLAFDRFREFDLPLEFFLPETGQFAWDMDVFVRPEYRLGTVFARLWDAAAAELRQRGVIGTVSLISAYNPASLRAHRRLKARELGSFTILKFWSLRVIFGGRLGPIFRVCLNDDYRAAVRVPDL